MEEFENNGATNGEIDGQLSFDLKPEVENLNEEPETVIMRPSFPMSVALIGAPGTGKEEIANRFSELATPWLEAQGEKFVVLENSGSLIERRYDIAMGQFGGYRENLWTFFNRLEREREAELAGESFITSGTILEALAHAGVNYEVAMLGSESGIITPETQTELQKIQITMSVLTFLFVDNFRYKFAFYVPRSESIIVPGQDETVEQRTSRRVDAALREIFRGFQLRIQVLDQPTNEERAIVAFETIKEIYEQGIEVPKGLAPQPVVSSEEHEIS